MTLGLAFVLRYGIQLIWGTQPRRLDVDVTSSFSALGLRIGRTELIVVLVGAATLVPSSTTVRPESGNEDGKAVSILGNRLGVSFGQLPVLHRLIQSLRWPGR